MIDSYKKKVNKHKILKKKEITHYVNTMQQCREELINGNLRFVVAIAHKYHKKFPNTDLEYLISIGNLVLIQVVDGYFGKGNVPEVFLPYLYRSLWNKFTDITRRRVYEDDMFISEEDLEEVEVEQLKIKNETAEVLLRKIINFRKTLDEREDAVFLHQMYYEDKTLQELATEFGVSQQMISKVKQQVIKKAKDYFVINDLIDLVGKDNV